MKIFLGLYNLTRPLLGYAIFGNCVYLCIYLCITSLNKDNIFLLILPQLFYEIFFLKVVDFKTNLLHVKGHEVYFFNSNLPDLQIQSLLNYYPKKCQSFLSIHISFFSEHDNF